MNIFYIILFAKILQSKVEHIKWLKFYSGLSIGLIGITFLLRFGYNYVFFLGDLLDVVLTIGHVVSALILPVVFFIEYKRQDEDLGTDNNLGKDYFAQSDNRESSSGYLK